METTASQNADKTGVFLNVTFLFQRDPQ